MSIEAVISTQVIDTTSVGRSLMTAADAAAARTAADAQVTLVSGTNIKTINSASLLGSGDITVGLSGLGSIDRAVVITSGTGGNAVQAASKIMIGSDGRTLEIDHYGDGLKTTLTTDVNRYFVTSRNMTIGGGGILYLHTGSYSIGANGSAVQIATPNSGGTFFSTLVASPNNTVNHVCLEAFGGTTNVSLSVKPKGSGSFTLSPPDGTGTGGNVRGAYVVDLQLSRSTSTQVASADYSTISGGRRNTIGASATDGAIGGGYLNTLSGFAYNSFIGCGNENTVSAGFSFIGSGLLNSVSAEYASVPCGRGGSATRYGQEAYASGLFAAVGDAQTVRFRVRNKTTNTTPTTLFLDGSSTRLTIPSGKVFAFTIRITGIKSDGTAVADYVRKGMIKRISNTTSLVGSIETIGTDVEDNASTDVAVTADDTNDALQISVTGIAAETWRWLAVVEGIEIAYGT